MMKEKLSSGNLHFRWIMLSAAIGTAVMLLTMLLCSVLLYREVLPANAMVFCGYGALALGGLICGVLSFHSRKRFFAAQCSAGFLFLLLFMIGFISDTVAFSAFSFILVLIILAFSAMIGIVLSTLFR
ncbi:hypothetical protein [Acidaminobacterium chupaoyuni]